MGELYIFVIKDEGVILACNRPGCFQAVLAAKKDFGMNGVMAAVEEHDAYHAPSTRLTIQELRQYYDD